ncbi:MAG: dihydrolipoyl dehydrogenase [Planctomycetota bacterium]|jgi:dihydrolipoamide dehydrogenase
MTNARKVVVIGAGPAGYVCAIRLAQLGQEVTVVEREALGGTCLNVGCIPSKALIAAGSLKHKLGEMETMGLKVSGVELDVEKLIAWKQGIVGKLTGGVGILLKNHGCKVVYGTASLVNKNTVRVDGKDGSQDLACDDIVIATGSVPLPIPGFDFGKHVWSSTEALAPAKLPKHLLVIGGGYIGLELGMMYSKLGVKVTVVEATPAPLPGQDPDCVKIIQRSMKKMGIDFVANAFAKGYEVKGAKKTVTVETKDGKQQQISCDQILCTVGRKPYAEGLGLEKVGVAMAERGFVKVDKHMRTNIPNIYCIGDIAGQPMLAHKGSKEGLVAAAVIAGQNEEYDVRCVPAVIFTAPEMASVGMQEQEAKDAGHEIAVGQFPFAASGRAMSLMETEGFVKIVADAKTDEVLGVHMVGPEVTELIAEATLAIEMGATTEDIARTIHAHPTLPEAMMEAAEAVHKMAVHIYQKR